MSAKSKLTAIMKKALAGKNEKTVPAVLGDYVGAVGTGKAFEVYARLQSGQVIKVINQIAPNTWDLKVTLGKRDGQRFWQVIGVRDAYEGIAAPNVADHTSQHRYLPIYRDQWIPLLLFPIKDTLTAQLFSSPVVVNGDFALVENQVLDFTSHIPTSGARWVLVQYDAAGAVTLVDGNIVASKEVLLISDVPNCAALYTAIGAVRLYTGQVALKYLDDFLYPVNMAAAQTLPIFNDDTLPEDVTTGTAETGTSPYPARRDHVHHFETSGIKYRQFVYSVSGGDFSFVITSDGEPVMVLQNAE
jgi:hypothetical protein